MNTLYNVETVNFQYFHHDYSIRTVVLSTGNLHQLRPSFSCSSYITNLVQSICRFNTVKQKCVKGDYKMDCKAVGERIKARKHELGITANDLQERSGVPLDTINNIVYGRTSDPRTESLAKIAQALDISLDYIVFGKDQDPQPHKQKDQLDIERYIQIVNESHTRETEARCKAKDEIIDEMRKSHDFWRKLSCILIGFLGAILAWLAVGNVIV